MTVRVAPHFRKFRLDTLAPSHLSEAPPDFQQQVIDAVKAHPHDGWAFFGQAGVGKTTLSSALITYLLNEAYQHEWGDSSKNRYHNWRERLEMFKGDIWRDPTIHDLGIWRIDAATLIEEHHRAVLRETVRLDGREKLFVPSLVKEQIDGRSSIFLEEMEKIGALTDHRFNVLFQIINQCYEQHSQLVIDTNLDRPTFEKHFTWNNSTNISRRVTAMCWKADYFAGKIMPPLETERMRNLDTVRIVGELRDDYPGFLADR